MRMRQFQYGERLIQQFNQKEQTYLEHLYDTEPHRKPKEYSSTYESVQKIKDEVEPEKKRVHLIEGSNRRLNIGDAANIIIKNIAMTVIPGEGDDTANLAVYDYDRKMYVMSYMQLNKYLVAILGSTSRNQIDSLIQTIVSREDELSYYNPLPKYKIAVGNGIFNCLTRQLEEFTPLYTVVTRIKTNYIENPDQPKFADRFTLEGMIGDFANQNPDRIQLLTQIVKSILTGINTSDVFFIVIGPGGDGKSTMFNMITNLIGVQNTAYLNFTEISQPDKLLTTLNKKLMLGMDNDVNLYIKKTALLKSMASHETITLNRKYMSSISVEFSPVIVQLCNEMPRFSETKESMRRRIVTFKSENSHYKNGTQNPNVKKYINDKRFLEYALWYFLNEDVTPYYNDYNEIDKDVTDESLNNEDIIGQFINEMVNIKYVSSINKYIPLRHFYALYLDWFNINNPGAKPMGMRTFKLKVSDEMYKLGYTFDPKRKHHRVPSLESNDLYSTSMLESYKDGYEMQKAIDSSNQVKCFELTHEAVKGASERVLRASHPVNVITYFDMTNELFQFAINNELEDEITEIDYNQPIEKINNINLQNDDLIESVYFDKNKQNVIQSLKNQTFDITQIDDLINIIKQKAIKQNDILTLGTIDSLNYKNQDDQIEIIIKLLEE